QAALGNVGDDRRDQRVAERARDALGEGPDTRVVLTQRHVRSVLLGPADGHDDGRLPRLDEPAQLGPRQLFQEHGHGRLCKRRRDEGGDEAEDGGAGRPERRQPSRIARSRAIRSSVGGCVEKSRAKLSPLRGLTMNRCAVAGFAGSGSTREATSIFSRALARPYERPASRAPLASAWNSRARDTANCTSMAAMGARMAKRIRTSGLLPPSSSSWERPPKMAAHCAMCAR